MIKPEVTVTLVNRIGETEQTHTTSVPILDVSNKNGPRTAKEAGELTFTAAEANRLRVKSGETPRWWRLREAANALNSTRLV